jgi:uncharacterized protein (DUF488 family)
VFNYTIGHSNHPIEKFLALLRQHGITLLADVRSTPASRFNPQFNRKALERSLAEAHIEYVFLGEALGARASDPTCYEDGRVSYDKLAATESFQQGIDRLEAQMSSHRVAIMCAEKEPLGCHRTILVARHLCRRAITVTHILASGELEAHASVLARLRTQLKLPADDLFAEGDDRAYELQARRIAYRQSTPATAPRNQRSK